MTSRERFLSAVRCEPLDRPPVWIMRQAGRYLPEYRALKQRHGFQAMVRTPELAAEATLLPLRRFPLDAAILFSDILVVPEAMGQPYRFRDQGGIVMEHALSCAADVARLDAAGAAGRLGHVAAALGLLRSELGAGKALLGFAGAPWTLATYMVEGGSSVDFHRIRALFHGDRPVFDALMEKLAAAVTAHLLAQIGAGADAVQIFDTWAPAVPHGCYREASLRWIRYILAGLPEGFPVILYARGAEAPPEELAAAGVSVLGLDAAADLAAVRRRLRDGGIRCAVQGNLDPGLMDRDPGVVALEARRLLGSMEGLGGHIFNLGHGIRPTARVECVEALASAVLSWRPT